MDGGGVTAGRVAVVLGLLFGLGGTGSSAVSVALPELARDLGITTAGSAWVISGYAVAFAVATAVHGRLADLVGIRGPLVTGVVLMAGGALLAGLAPAFSVVMVGRVVQGCGAAAVPVLGPALVSARWSGPTRSRALGRMAGMAATVSALGPAIGGSLHAASGWRASVVLPMAGLFALPVLWRVAPRSGAPGRLDAVGALLVAGAAAGLVLLVQSPAAGRGAALVGAVLLGAGIPAVVAWIRVRPDGFLPRAVITNSVVVRGAMAGAVIPAGWFALLVAVPTELAARGWSPLAIGLLMAPSALAALLMPRVTRVLLTRVGPGRILLVACPLAGVGVLLAASGAATDVAALLAVSVMAVTVAFSMGQPAMVDVVGSAVDEAQRGVALGIATLIFLVGAGVGAAVVGGLAGLLGVGGALAVLAVVPAGGTVLMAWWPLRRVAPG